MAEVACAHDFATSRLHVIAKTPSDAFRAFVGGLPTTVPIEYCIHCGELRLSPAARAQENIERSKDPA